MKVGRRAEGRGRRGSCPVSLREKKNFEEERRKKKKPERERIGNSFLTWEEREVNKKLFFFLDVSYSAHLKIDVHCSGEAKNFAYCSTAVSFFYVQWF